MTKTKITIIVGARPNYMKIVRFKEVAETLGLDINIIHTGQHFSDSMKKDILNQLNIGVDSFLILKSTHPVQRMSEMIDKISKAIDSNKPDYVLIPGDTDTALAGAIAANKLGKKIIHLESGLRSFDKTMPEETNRILVDHLSDILFTTEYQANTNLKNENIKKNVYLVGNTMVENIIRHKNKILKHKIKAPNPFCICTIHRQSNVDNLDNLTKILNILNIVAKDYDVIFPMHPRTSKKIFDSGIAVDLNKNVHITEPLNYIEFQKHLSSSDFIITDSGGIQSEASYWNKPCIVFRENTEKIEDLRKGTTVLCFDMLKIIYYVTQIKNGEFKQNKINSYSDKITEKIFEILLKTED